MYAGRNPGLAGKTTWKDNLSMKDHSPILKRNLTGCVAAVLLILFDQFTKMLAVAITRIDAETDDHDFKKAYNEAKAMSCAIWRTVAPHSE